MAGKDRKPVFVTNIGKMKRMDKESMSIQDKKREIDKINEKLSVMGSRELIIIHTTITALYNRQQIEEYEQALSNTDKGCSIV